MNQQLERELTAWMREQAEQTSNSSPGDGLAPGALRRARRIRRRRRITSALVAAAVLSVAVPAGTVVLDRLRDTAGTTVADRPGGPDGTERTDGPERTDGTERAATPTGAPTVRLDFDALPRGTTTAAWWAAESRRIHEGERSLPFKEVPDSLSAVDIGTGTGYLVHRYGNVKGWNLGVFDRKYVWTLANTEVSSPKVSGDRALGAYSTPTARGAVLRAADMIGTQTVFEKRLAGVARVDVAGFSERFERLVFTSTGSGSTEAKVWTFNTGEVTALPGAVRAWATDPSSGLVAVGTRLDEENDPTGNGRWCSAVIDTSDGNRRLWESCELTPIGFSPDGRFAVAQPSTTEGAGPISYTVVDARTGEPVLEVRADLLSRFTWEDDGQHLVLQAYAGGSVALVRCDLDGTCELITDPAKSDFPADPEPYVLSTR